MSEAYQELLEATVQHLEGLKARGVRFVAVAPETLAALGQSQPARVARLPVAPAPKAVPPNPPPARPAPSEGRSAEPQPVQAKPNPPVPLALGIEGEPETPPALPVLEPQAKIAAFEDLRRRAMACVKCPHLAAARRNVVFGVGDINAQLMFVGEAPGADEDVQGEPFVGKAGQLLTRIIQTMGLSRESVYIANILKCRPDTPGQSAGNRKPTSDEMQTCIPFLHEQIDLIRPKVLVALGGTAVEGLLGKTVGITRLRGHWQIYRGIPLMPTYHPAYLLRNQAPSEKRRVWEDMLQVMERLELKITERQRSFFSKGNG